MKLGIMADVFRELSWEEACRSAKKLGLEAIEPIAAGYGSKNHCNAIEFIKDKDKIKRFTKTAKENATRRIGIENTRTGWGRTSHK